MQPIQSKSVWLFGFLCSLVLISVICSPSMAATQTRIQPEHLIYQGAFRLPDVSDKSNWGYSGYAMAYYPDGDPSGPDDGYPGSLFMIGHDHHQLVSEISIPKPAISQSKDVSELNTAGTLQGFADITGGMFWQGEMSLEIPRAGLAYLPAQGSQTSGKLYFCWGQHFQEFWASHGWCELDLSHPNPAGPWYFGTYTNYATNDYLFEIPSNWASENTSGQRLVSGRFRDGQWSGYGPALFAFAPWNDGNPPAAETILSSITPLLLYGVQNPGEVEITLSDDRKMFNYKEPDEWSGGAWLTSGTNSAVILGGTKATGNTWYGFSNGVVYPIQDPPEVPYPEVPAWPHDERGWWSEGIRAQLIFFDPDDLAAVANGTMNTWDPQPYAILDLDAWLFNPGFDYENGKRYLLGAMAYDPARNLLYVVERLADEDKSLVHVWYVTSGESAPMTTRLYFPHVDSGNSWETEIGVIYTGSGIARGVFKAYDNNGNLVSTTVSTALGTYGRREITIGDEFRDPDAIGYIVYETQANAEDISGYLKFYENGRYRVAVPAVTHVNQGNLPVPHIASDDQWWTGVSLVNTNDSSVNLTITFDDGTVKNRTIPGHGHDAFTIRGLFNGQAQPGIESAMISGGAGVIGLELFGSHSASGPGYLSGILLKDTTTKDLYYPHIASDSQWWTGVVAYNPSASTTILTLTPYTGSGQVLTGRTLSLGAGEKLIGTADTLNFPSETAWFRIQSTQGITGFELFGTTDAKQLAGYTGVDIAGSQGCFQKIERSGWSGIAFVNTAANQATVTLRAYDDNANVIAEETITLGAYEKRVGLAQDIFQSPVSDFGYASHICYESANTIVGFQLNGSSDNTLLDGLPGI